MENQSDLEFCLKEMEQNQEEWSNHIYDHIVISPDKYYIDTTLQEKKAETGSNVLDYKEYYQEGISKGHVHVYDTIWDLPKEYLQTAVRHLVLTQEGTWLNDKFYIDHDVVNKALR